MANVRHSKKVTQYFSKRFTTFLKEEWKRKEGKKKNEEKEWKKAVGVTWEEVCFLALRRMDAVSSYT